MNRGSKTCLKITFIGGNMLGFFAAVCNYRAKYKKKKKRHQWGRNLITQSSSIKHYSDSPQICKHQPINKHTHTHRNNDNGAESFKESEGPEKGQSLQ